MPLIPATSLAVAQAQRAAQDSQLRLFGRVYSLILAQQPQPTSFVGSNPGYFEQLGNAIEITDLRVQFTIKKNLGKEPNSCVVTISNLSKTTRESLRKRPVYAILSAGYDGVVRHLFSGNVTYGQSKRDGTEWETKLQISDGGRAYTYARMARSYRKPVSAYAVLNDAASSMGLKLPPEAEQDPALKQALATGISAHGPSRDILTKLLAPYGKGWSVQNGRLVVLSDDEVLQTAALDIDDQAGIIGEPELSVPHKPSDPSELTLEVQLYPEIQVGSSINLTSESATGLYRVNEVTHSGDNYGDDWKTTVKATLFGQSPKHKGKRR